MSVSRGQDTSIRTHHRFGQSKLGFVKKSILELLTKNSALSSDLGCGNGKIFPEKEFSEKKFQF